MKSKIYTCDSTSLSVIREELNSLIGIKQCSTQYWWNKDALKKIALTINPSFTGPFEPAKNILPDALVGKWKPQETVGTHPNRANTIMLYKEVYDALHPPVQERPIKTIYTNQNDAKKRFDIPILDFYKMFIKAHHESASYEKMSYLLEAAIEDYHGNQVQVKTSRLYGKPSLREYFSDGYYSYLKNTSEQVNKRFNFVSLHLLPNKEKHILTVEEELSIWYADNY